MFHKVLKVHYRQAFVQFLELSLIADTDTDWLILNNYNSVATDPKLLDKQNNNKKNFFADFTFSPSNGGIQWTSLLQRTQGGVNTLLMLMQFLLPAALAPASHSSIQLLEVVS